MNMEALICGANDVALYYNKLYVVQLGTTGIAIARLVGRISLDSQALAWTYCIYED